MIRNIKSFLSFYFKASTRYSIHSPFVFDFIKNVLEDNRLFYAYHEVETTRKLLLTRQNTIKVTDLGAGSMYKQSSERSIQQIAKTALSNPRSGRLLFRLCNYFKPKNIIELGTSLGISTAYLQKGAQHAKVYTLEGCPEISQEAKKVFKQQKLKNIERIVGHFDQTFPKLLNTIQKADLIYFDGNHQKEATINYFEKALKHKHNDSIFIFDDIYWSVEMTEAWEQIKSNQDVQLSIDLYDMGLIFFNKNIKEKQHFKLVPWYWKPWRMGFLK